MCRRARSANTEPPGGLAPPEQRGRVGIYGREQLERLRPDRPPLMIAQAAASMVVHQLGEALLAAGNSPEGRGIDKLPSAVRIGVVT